MSAAARPRLAVLHPSGLIGENAGLLDLHVRSLIELLEPLGWSVDARSPPDPGFAAGALGSDLTVIQMLASAEVEAVIRQRRELGRPTVYEITDNLLGAGGWLPSSHLAHSPLARQSILYHAHLSDALQMLVPALADLFAAVNSRALVFHPYVPIPPEPPAKPPGFIFGWSGSRSHAESLAAAAPAVIEFCLRHPEATFAFMGDREMFDDIFEAIATQQTRVYPFSGQEGHLRFVAGLHVGLAPMLPTPFNATRADTRVCIYAGQRVAAVLQDAPAHRPHRERARIYRTPRELLEILEELFHDRGQVNDLAQRAREWIERERSARALGEERDRAYRRLLEEASGGPPKSPPPPPDRGQLGPRLADASTKQPEEALVAARSLLAEAPGFEQAHLLVLRSLEKLGRDQEALDHAAGLDPSPVYADLIAELQARIARRVRPEEERLHLEKIRSPFRRARLGAEGSPTARSRAVLQHQPYDHFALASTILRLRAEDPASPELAELYERACILAPQDVPADHRPRRLAPFLPT